MRVGASNQEYSTEQYVEHELNSETRSEFINGQLFEIAGEKT